MEVFMRSAILMCIACISFLSKGISNEKLISDIRVNLKSENLLASEEGIFLITDEFGLVALNNLQFDERGCYTICHIAYICTNCMNQLTPDSSGCDVCGSEEIDAIGVGENGDNKYLTAQAILTAFLVDPSQWEGKIQFCGHFKGKAGVDDEGTKSVSIQVTETDNNDIDYSATIKVEEKDENRTASAEVEVKYRDHNDVDYSATVKAKEENGKITKSIELEVEFDF